MSDKSVRFTVSLTIAEGKLAEFEKVVEAMLADSRREPGIRGYDWYLSADQRQCRLLETYVDSAAVLAHMTGPAVREGVPKLLAVASLNSFEVYGDPDPKAAAMLDGFGATIFSGWRALK
jgi:quinol monooxygenase YgiN